MSDLDTGFFCVDDTEASVRPADAETLELTTRHAMVAMEFSLQWKCENAQHSDRLVTDKVNLWRDFFPPAMEMELTGKPVGHSMEHNFTAGELTGESYREQMCVQERNSRFNRQFRKGLYVEPRQGRFYPRGFVAGVRGILAEDIMPFRLGAVDDEGITIELNHPLADRELRLSSRILDIWAGRAEHGGACNDIADLVTANGPGMQARWRNLPTDFWSDLPFSRMAPEPDAAFHAIPRLVSHIDTIAQTQIARLYEGLLQPGMVILDLMTSWQSHLPEAMSFSEVAGLGMNQEEMDANPRLTEKLIQDINLHPTLPYADQRFDAVICNLSVDYMTRPFEIFDEVARILKPGGRFILTFTNRWHDPKVIRIWTGIHEFERPGLVLEYFLKSGRYKQLETYSLRGLPRPADDKYADRQPQSDPIYAVWGTRS